MPSIMKILFLLQVVDVRISTKMKTDKAIYTFTVVFVCLIDTSREKGNKITKCI